MSRLLQFTLDLFDPPRIEPDHQPVPPGVRPGAQAAPPPRKASEPTRPLQQSLVPATFAHPQASRQALLGDSVVGYALRRGKRRSIGFVVGPEGLTVSAPRWVPLVEIDAAVKSKSGWILKQLEQARERQRRLESARIEWKDGASFPFLGEPVIVVIDPRHAFDEVGAVLNADAQALPGVPRLTLHLGLSHAASAEQVREAVQAWLMRQAKRLFTERLDHFAPRLGVQWRKLSLSSAGTRWGMAHSDGSIRLNWRLIHFRLPVIDYVVAHELSHLRVMNHSPRFWQTVCSVVPDYAQLRGQLKDQPLPTF